MKKYVSFGELYYEIRQELGRQKAQQIHYTSIMFNEADWCIQISDNEHVHVQVFLGENNRLEKSEVAVIFKNEPVPPSFISGAFFVRGFKNIRGRRISKFDKKSMYIFKSLLGVFGISG